MSLASRWERVCEDVRRVCIEAGRDPDSVTVVAVSKTVGPEAVAQAIDAGMTDFGENRSKPFNEKHALYPQARWHFIGTLQSNKAKEVVGKACLIHSVDRSSVLGAIQKAAVKADVVQDILIEVSVSGEESKGGIAPDELEGFVEEVLACPNVRCKGLMTMAPRGDEDVARETFAGLRKLAAKLSEVYGERDTIGFSILSMGMTEDYRVAIQEGSTMVRIGRRIFSEDFE